MHNKSRGWGVAGWGRHTRRRRWGPHRAGAAARGAATRERLQGASAHLGSRGSKGVGVAAGSASLTAGAEPTNWRCKAGRAGGQEDGSAGKQRGAGGSVGEDGAPAAGWGQVSTRRRAVK